MTILSQPILLFINLTLFTSIYSFNNANSIKGYSLDQMVWYFTSYMVIMCFIWNSLTEDISRKILTGDLAGDLEVTHLKSNRNEGVCLI